MLRRSLTVLAVAVLTAIALASPARADHTTDHTIAQMTAHYQDPGLEVQNRPFALLYLRTTEGMRDANNAGEFPKAVADPDAEPNGVVWKLPGDLGRRRCSGRTDRRWPGVLPAAGHLVRPGLFHLLLVGEHVRHLRSDPADSRRDRGID